MVSAARRQQGDDRKDAIIVFIYAYRRQPPRRSPSMGKIAAGALVTVDGQRRPLLERSAINYHLRRMRTGNPDSQHVPAAYQGLVSWVAGEHNSVQLTRKGTRHAERLLADDPGRVADVVAAATHAADPSTPRTPPGTHPPPSHSHSRAR